MHMSVNNNNNSNNKTGIKNLLTLGKNHNHNDKNKGLSISPWDILLSEGIKLFLDKKLSEFFGQNS